jgi:hypothetical protein
MTIWRVGSRGFGYASSVLDVSLVLVKRFKSPIRLSSTQLPEAVWLNVTNRSSTGFRVQNRQV